MCAKQTIDILGGGIMGLMSAYHLGQNGHDVTLYDPEGFPAKNASWIAGGMLAPYSEIEHMNSRWVEASLQSIALWKDMPFETGFTQNGSILIAHNEDRHALERFKSHLPKNLQHSTKPQDIEVQIPEKFKQSIFLEEEAHLIPETTMHGLCEFLKDKVGFKEQAMEPKKAKAEWVIDCRGMGANDKNLRGVKGEIALVRNTEFKLTRPVRLMHPRYPLYIVPRPDNVFMIGATIIESDENNDISLRSSMELLSALYSLHPSFGEAQVLGFKAGIRPSYPDNLPRITTKESVIQANGLFRHGFLLSPLMAEIVATKISGQSHKYEDLLNGQTTNKAGDQWAA